MALVASPYGFALRYNPSGQSRAKAYAILPAYTTAIGFGDGVILDTNGSITVGTAANDLIGVFAGCEYVDPTGKPNVSKNWPGTAGCTNIVAWVHDDPNNVYEGQFAISATTVLQAAIGDQVDLVAGTPNALTGQSAQSFNATLKGAGVQGQFRILGVGVDGFYDALANPFPTALVQIARHQFLVAKTAI
jgi:hypothetical protein